MAVDRQQPQRPGDFSGGSADWANLRWASQVKRKKAKESRNNLYFITLQELSKEFRFLVTRQIFRNIYIRSSPKIDLSLVELSI